MPEGFCGATLEVVEYPGTLLLPPSVANGSKALGAAEGVLEGREEFFPAMEAKGLLLAAAPPPAENWELAGFWGGAGMENGSKASTAPPVVGAEGRELGREEPPPPRRSKSLNAVGAGTEEGA